MKNIVADTPTNENKSEKSLIALREEEMLKFWQDNKIFEKSEAKGKKEFIFYDGPPFATGLPHHGHILAGTIKDAIPRYRTMQGDRVYRRWGWDCHGLPLENIIEKELGLKTKKDIEVLGVEKFNQAARAAVLRYADDWKRIIPRMGRWVDMDNAYRTMDATYTESVWWSFKTLYDKGLIYQGFKGMQLCPRCETTLSNFEVAQGYKDITDIAVTVKFELADEPGTYLLAWTTTPWTLPGNMAAAVNAKTKYAKVRVVKNYNLSEGQMYPDQKNQEEYFILAKDKVESILKGPWNIEDEFFGEKLIGKSYKPIFDYYAKTDFQNKENAWKVYAADYVTAEDGTGIVHLAPAYGAEDLALAEKKKIPVVHHVGVDGKFKKEVTDLEGLSAKPKGDPRETDKKVVELLKQKEALFAEEHIEHSYPFCWRCDTPLLNYASVSWFVSVTQIKEKLLKENKKIDWVPEHIGSGRFNNILETAPDWAISRSRYWGAPLPVWQCTQCESREVVGSFDELKKKQKTNENHFIFVRHGESKNNVAGVLSCLENDGNGLTEKGKKQVATLAKQLKKKKIDIIFTSPILRARETAELLAEQLAVPKEHVVIDDRLRELNFGDFNKKTHIDFMKFDDERPNWYENSIPGGESYLDAKKRVGQFLYETDSCQREKNILVVGHGITLESAKAIVEGADTARSEAILNSFTPKNTDLLEFDFTPISHNEKYELDVHRPYIDEIKFSCECGGEFKRVPEVFDCWYESGSMPYGSAHYPFDKKKFDPAKKRGYPANFIAEGLDQTRGWFYSMLVLSTALFGKAAYQNVIVNGLILAQDGQKMSKKLKNYTDPSEVVDKFGADALRYYLLSSPVVRSEDTNFTDRGVDEISKKITARLENVLSFYEMYRRETKANALLSKNVLDQWILARLGELAKEVTSSMDKYELDKATRPFLLFIDDLSTWYLRRSRERFKGDDENDKAFALATTRHVLKELSRLIAPFMPFIAEYVFQKLKTKGDAESVHLERWPKISKIDQKILKNMETVRSVVSLGLEARSKAGIKVRQPLQSLSIPDRDLLKQSALLELIKDEVNVKEVILGTTQDLLLDTRITPELEKEGFIRDLIREIQDKRKEMKLSPKDKVTVTIQIKRSDTEGFSREIGKAVNAINVSVEGGAAEETVLVRKV